MALMAVGSRGGTTLHNINEKAPRKDLMNRLGSRHAEKIYVDRKSSAIPMHVGYIIGGEWWTLYNVEPWEGRKGA